MMVLFEELNQGVWNDCLTAKMWCEWVKKLTLSSYFKLPSIASMQHWIWAC